MAVRGTGDETRSIERLRHHFEVERRLADRLRRASRCERPHMLTGLYQELFAQVPDHPRLTRKHSPEQSRRAVEQQMHFLRRFLRPGMTFLEVGPGDCALSFRVAERARKVYGVDVDVTLTRNPRSPKNFELCISDGVDIPVPAASVDLAYSNQLMEHLHPDDAEEQLRNIFQAIAPGGLYICLTPNRLTGPHDVSRYFCEEATGFHLKEYTIAELQALFFATGFRSLQTYAATKGRWFRFPVSFLTAVEAGLARLDTEQRMRVGDRWPVKQLLAAAVVATK
jgi:SAM-dependent methyltransferase